MANCTAVALEGGHSGSMSQLRTRHGASVRVLGADVDAVLRWSPCSGNVSWFPETQKGLTGLLKTVLPWG